MDQPRVLIVDDEPGVRESLRLILKDRAATTLADTGEAALACVEKQSFDVAFYEAPKNRRSGDVRGFTASHVPLRLAINAARSLAMIFRKQGETHALAKDPEKAIAAFERAIALDPNSDEAATARDYIAVLNRRPDLPTVSESESKRQN